MNAFLAHYFPNAISMIPDFEQATFETLYMTFFTAIIGGLIGLLIGVILVLTDPEGISENDVFYTILDKIVNFFRSVPFIIMLAVIAPFTRIVVGTSIGTTACIVPLVIAVIPFYARQVQNALLDVDSGIIESAQAMGSSTWGIVFRVYLKEGLPKIIRSSVVTLISLIGLTAMAGTVGGGGLGNLAVIVGYQRYENDVTLVALVLILIIVFAIQIVGDVLARMTDHENTK